MPEAYSKAWLRALHPGADFGGRVRRCGETDLLHLNDELVVSLVLARCQTLADGRHRWRIRFDPAGLAPDLTLAVRLDHANQSELDYFLLPALDLPRHEIRMSNRTSADFECFRFDDLRFFYGMTERARICRDRYFHPPAQEARR